MANRAGARIVVGRELMICSVRATSCVDVSRDLTVHAIKTEGSRCAVRPPWPRIKRGGRVTGTQAKPHLLVNFSRRYVTRPRCERHRAQPGHDDCAQVTLCESRAREGRLRF